MLSVHQTLLVFSVSRPSNADSKFSQQYLGTVCLGWS